MGTCDLHINEAIALGTGLYRVPTEWLNVWCRVDKLWIHWLCI